MSRRNKLEKFAELLTFSNVYQNYRFKDPKLQWVDGEVVDRKGAWSQDHFGNQHPIVVELACGGGEYTLALATQSPDKNFIGVDIKGNRIWKGARKALAQKLANAAFLRTRIEQLELFFGPNEISEIWITFPDPFLRKSQANRRLTAKHFLHKYRSLLMPDGRMHLKTDSPELYEFTLETLESVEGCRLTHHADDIYSAAEMLPELQIQTFYEKMHREEGRQIKYIQWTFDRLTDGRG